MQVSVEGSLEISIKMTHTYAPWLSNSTPGDLIFPEGVHTSRTAEAHSFPQNTGSKGIKTTQPPSSQERVK